MRRQFKTSVFCLLTFCLVIFTLAASSVMAWDPIQDSATLLVDDDFSSESYELRSAARGDWKIKDGVASVTQDDALFKKFKNHGPIVAYKVSHDDATAIMEFKPTGCKTVVFTMDAENGGHAFRVKMRVQPKGKGSAKKKGNGKAGPSSQVVTYAPKVGDEKAEQILLSKDIPKLKEGEWNRLEVTVRGEDATVKLGETTVKVSHSQIDQKKGVAKIGFSFGGFAIRKFQLSP